MLIALESLDSPDLNLRKQSAENVFITKILVQNIQASLNS
jgi:hypothetical protein